MSQEIKKLKQEIKNLKQIKKELLITLNRIANINKNCDGFMHDDADGCRAMRGIANLAIDKI